MHRTIVTPTEMDKRIPFSVPRKWYGRNSLNMKKLKVIVCKAANGVSAHIEGIEEVAIARHTVYNLKKDLPEGLRFHIEGLYEEERKSWMKSEYAFELQTISLDAH